MKIKNYEIPSEITGRISFLLKFIESPMQVGSVTPSSRFLTEKILEPIDWEDVRSIAELGAGTGVFTKQIHELKHPDCQVVVFEKNDKMRHQLCSDFPEAAIGEDALQLTQTLELVDIEELDCVVSGLPFALFDKNVRVRIIDEVINALKPDGIFVIFQYSLQMKNLLASKFPRVETSFVPFNIPPAFVYVCRK